ncbi:hypothetical protein FNF27_08049 [Cafeteria roenbergensis]|uniref:Cyclin N-terminal domain-containing protein n=1 Tax=Cafeteria roenbergensis TaxID=33653 RepID=A0A5A8DAG6_CAFRO|nr:hypothetical protein FNF27_08049 [Cafeteria roenbergensis]
MGGRAGNFTLTLRAESDDVAAGRAAGGGGGGGGGGAGGLAGMLQAAWGWLSGREPEQEGYFGLGFDDAEGGGGGGGGYHGGVGGYHGGVDGARVQGAGTLDVGPTASEVAAAAEAIEAEALREAVWGEDDPYGAVPLASLRFHEREFDCARFAFVFPSASTQPSLLGGAPHAVRRFPRHHRVPTPRAIEEVAALLYRDAELSPECSVIALIYAERLMATAGVTLLACNWRPVLVASLLLASKVWQDLSTWNAEFTDILAEWPLAGINELERRFVSALGFNLFIAPSTFAKYYFALRSLGEDVGFRRRLMGTVLAGSLRPDDASHGPAGASGGAKLPPSRDQHTHRGASGAGEAEAHRHGAGGGGKALHGPRGAAPRPRPAPPQPLPPTPVIMAALSNRAGGQQAPGGAGALSSEGRRGGPGAGAGPANLGSHTPQARHVRRATLRRSGRQANAMRTLPHEGMPGGRMAAAALAEPAGVSSGSDADSEGYCRSL